MLALISDPETCSRSCLNIFSKQIDRAIFNKIIINYWVKLFFCFSLFSIKAEQFSNERKQSGEEETLSFEPPKTIPIGSNKFLVHVDEFANSNNVGKGLVLVMHIIWVPTIPPRGLPTSEFRGGDLRLGGPHRERKKDRSEVASSEFRVPRWRAPRGGELWEVASSERWQDSLVWLHYSLG